MKIEQNKLYTFKVKNRKEREQGIIVANGDEWLLIKHIFADYIVDGYMLLNKKYIEELNRTKEDEFIENVLRASNKIGVVQTIDIPLSTNLLLKWLEENQKVFQIQNSDETMCWIGKILSSTDKSIFLTPLSPKGIWQSSYYTFRKANIRMISFDSDYITSLLNYNKAYCK